MKKLLITSGPTRIPLDSIRFISNHSSGTFGTHVAEEGLKAGFQVTMLHGLWSKTPSPQKNLKLISIETNDDLNQALQRELTTQRYDAVIHAMAVLDFQPEKVFSGKKKTRDTEWNLKLVPTPKIINQIKKWSPDSILVGFKLEVDVNEATLLNHARQLLQESNADWVLANQLTEGDDERHEGILLNRKGEIVFREMGKHPIANKLIQMLSR